MPLFQTVEYIARNLGRERSAIFISPRYLCAIEIRELWHVWREAKLVADTRVA